MNADTKTTCIDNTDILLKHQNAEMYRPSTYSRLSGFAKNLTVCISLTAAFGCNRVTDYLRYRVNRICYSLAGRPDE